MSNDTPSVARCEPPEGLRGVDGWHWLQYEDEEPRPYIWRSDMQRWVIAMQWGEPDRLRRYHYLCPIPSASELQALVRAGRAMLETAQMVARPAFEDTQHGAEVAALGERIGFGALMSSASATWGKRLDIPGGEFLAGPCRATAVREIRALAAALAAPGIAAIKDVEV